MGVTLSGIESQTTHLSGNPIEILAKSSGIPSGASGYEIMLKIESTKDVLFGSPFVDAVAPDSNLEALFDISGYVDQGIEKDIHWPIPEKYSGRVHAHDNGSYTIKLYPGEKYIDTNGKIVENFSATPTQSIFIVPGRIPYGILAELNDMGETWFHRYCEKGAFFSYMPKVQQVTPYQPIKLWWIPPFKEEGNVPVEVKVRYYIGGISKTIVIYDLELWYDCLFEFDCHPEGNNIPLENEYGRLEKYEVWIESEGNIICEKRTFEVSWLPPVEQYWYLFVDNRMGGVECISLTGRTRYEPQGEHTLVDIPFRRGGGAKTATTLIKASSRKRRWVVNSGIKPKDELESLDFILDTPQAWLAIPPSDGDTSIWKYKLAPVIIANSELVLWDDMKSLGSIDLELVEAR